jgi:hypothetical protein
LRWNSPEREQRKLAGQFDAPLNVQDVAMDEAELPWVESDANVDDALGPVLIPVEADEEATAS